MTFIVADRVQETTNSPGTGTATLLGAVSGYQSFSTGIGANNTTFYVIADQLGTNWEVGLGALNATGTVLTRTTVYSSSNGGSTVNFATGTQYVWCDFPASKSVLQGSAVNFSSIGATTAGTGAFTTLSASSTVSGAGFSNYFAAPPTIGNTTPNAGTFTALVATSITDSGLTAGRVNYNGVGGLLQDSANMTFDGSTLTTLNSAYTGTFTGGTGIFNLGSGQFYKDANGNVGIGCTPSTWNSTFRALELGTGGSSICEYNNSNVYVMNNNYFNVAGNYVYKTSAEAGQFIIGNGQAYINGADSGTAGNTITFTQIFSVKKDKSLALQSASPVTGIGISFPATQSASSDANTLDDYEEGTWTPVLAGSTSTTGQSYYQQAGRYTKIGNICIAHFDAGLTNVGVLVGNAQINGLPFSAANTGDISQGSGSLSLFASLATSLVSANIGPQPNGNWINLRGLTAASGSTTNSFTATTFFNSSSRLSGVIVYQVA